MTEKIKADWGELNWRRRYTYDFVRNEVYGRLDAVKNLDEFRAIQERGIEIWERMTSRQWQEGMASSREIVGATVGLALMFSAADDEIALVHRRG